ncbi:hypothetical protein O203_15890 [Ectopseudomonas chengduensis]|nr:DUF262 domain-containing protein [Pseudomonas chengduensis]ERH49509.1 hypothetical protein O203_15890 [Pseudomonas chengduensis]
MRLLPSDPDIETIVSRIKNKDIDLQPDFQRGEVWSKSKKQRLIDSILRDWHVPPIHVIEDVSSRKQEVLDGQQRLAAIRDFSDGEFAIDGTIEPADETMLAVHGMKYRDLPDSYRRRFNQFTIRLFRIVDYKAGEPGELFFRLNQPTSLTGAEQRNAFFGAVRSQIKEMVESFDELGLDKSYLGFSNSRMAYDDVLARVAITLERKTLNTKITSSDLIDLYRSETALSSQVTSVIREALRLMAGVDRGSLLGLKFNKATLYSWLIFLSRAISHGMVNVVEDNLNKFMHDFNFKRALGGIDNTIFGIPASWVINIYESRSSARVADVSSVLLRDAIIWMCFYDALGNADLHDIEDIITSFYSGENRSVSFEDDAIARALQDSGWGDLS